MGLCVEKLPHHTDECNTSDGLQVFRQEDGTYDGFCFACGVRVPDPYGEKGPSEEAKEAKGKSLDQIVKELKEIQACPSDLSLPDRKLNAASLQYFGYRFGLSRVDGETVETVYRPGRALVDGTIRTVAYSAKILKTKQTWWVKRKEDKLLPYGWAEAITTLSPVLYITEGPEDMVALYQALRERSAKNPAYAKQHPAVISLTYGAGSAVRQLSGLRKEIVSRFKEVVLVFDSDEAGQAAAREVNSVVFPQAKNVLLPYKDPNDCLIKGEADKLVNAVLHRQVDFKTSRLVAAKSLHSKAKIPAKLGYPWPYPSLTFKTRGYRRGEVYYFGAAQKMGKSDLMDELIEHAIRENGLKVLAIKPEQNNVMSYKRIVGKLASKIFHDPHIPFDEQAFDEASNKISEDSLLFVDLYQSVKWDMIREDIKEAAAAGVDIIFIDPLTNFVAGLDPSTANSELGRITQELARLALDLDVIIMVTCHLNNPDSGPPHDRGGKVLTSQFTGSRSMGRSANYIFGFEGNKDPELPEEERNCRVLTILDDREFGESGRVDLFYDKNTGRYSEI